MTDKGTTLPFTIAVYIDAALDRFGLIGRAVDGLRELVDSAVARWMFVPPTVSGSLATVRSPMRITLAARSLDKDYSVTLDRVDFRSAHAASEKEAVKTDSPAL